MGSSVLRSRYLCGWIARDIGRRWRLSWLRDDGSIDSRTRERERERERKEGIKRSWSKIKKPMAQRSANVNEAEFLISCNAAAGGVRQDFINSYRDDVSRGLYPLSTKFRAYPIRIRLERAHMPLIFNFSSFFDSTRIRKLQRSESA